MTASRPAWSPVRLAVIAGMASYLDGGALVASGLAIGGLYAEPLSLGDTAIGVLLGLQTVSFAIGALVGGRVGDRWGRRRVLVASLVVYAVGVGALAAAHTSHALALGVVMSGLAIGGDLPVSLALVAEQAPPGLKGRLVALTHLLWVSGIAGVGLLGLVLADLGALAGRLIYLHLLVIAVVVVLLRLQLPESDEWRLARGAATSSSSMTALTRGGRWRAPLLLAAFYTSWTLGSNTLGQFKPYLWINVMGGSSRGASVLILIGLPVGLALSSVFLWVADTRSRRRWMRAGSLVALSGWAAVAVWPGREAFVYLVLSFVVGASFQGEVAFKMWSQQLLPTLTRASVQGATMAIARLTAAGVASVTPAVASASPRAFFVAMLSASALATASCWRLTRWEADPPGVTGA